MVIGAGTVGTRKALKLHEAGAFVRVVAPRVSPILIETAEASGRLKIEHRDYAGAQDIGDAELVFAATDSHTVNEQVARDARALHRLVNVASNGSDGNFISMAVHRAGRITIGVSAGGVPAAAVEIRDAIAGRLEDLVTQDVESMARERSRTIASESR